MGDAILDYGIQIVLFFQGLGEWLIGPMLGFSLLGNEEFYLLVAPAIYWCINAAAGLRVGLLLMISASANYAFKLILHQPRPFWYDPQVEQLSVETSFGTPSGHAQNAVAVWGYLAAVIRRRWAWAAALFLILMIGFSRIYLGLHFPSDVLIGWLIGGALVWAFLRLEAPAAAWLKRRELGEQIMAVLSAGLVMILVSALIKLSLSSWVFPASWAGLVVEIGADTQEITIPNPFELSGVITAAGAFVGLAVGGLLLAPHGGFQAHGSALLRFLRFPIGAAGVFLLWWGLGEIFPRGEFMLAYGLRFLRYTLIGLWIAAGAPLLFIRLGLAEPLAGRSSGEWVHRPASEQK